MHGGAPGFGWGYIGVDIFFVVSGYLITGILLQEHGRTGRISLLSFYRRRALRLLPAVSVLCAALLCFSYVALKDPTQGVQEILVVVFYVGNWARAFNTGLPQYLGHTWSLAIEEQFYTIWPLLLLTLISIRPTPLFLFRVALGLTICIACWRGALAINGSIANRLYNGTDTRADALFIGACLAFAQAIPNIASWLGFIALRFWLLAVLIIVAVPAMFRWDDRHMYLGGFTAVAMAAALILAAALQEGPLARLLTARPLVWIGRRSYGLYLWHYPVMLVGLLQFHILQAIGLTAIEVTIASAIAALSYKFIERPFMQLRYANKPCAIPESSGG